MTFLLIYENILQITTLSEYTEKTTYYLSGTESLKMINIYYDYFSSQTKVLQNGSHCIH